MGIISTNIFIIYKYICHILKTCSFAERGKILSVHKKY